MTLRKMNLGLQTFVFYRHIGWFRHAERGRGQLKFDAVELLVNVSNVVSTPPAAITSCKKD